MGDVLILRFVNLLKTKKKTDFFWIVVSFIAFGIKAWAEKKYIRNALQRFFA